MNKSIFCYLILIFTLISCDKEDLILTIEQQDQLSTFMGDAEEWSEAFLDLPLIPYGAFAPETRTSFSSIISTEESRNQIDQFIADLGIANDHAMHDWMLDYGTLIREIKVDNVVQADDEYYRLLSSMGIGNGTDTDSCINEAHAMLQKHAYHKALSYSSTTQAVNGPAFDLNNFMTLRGIGSALYRMHRFIDTRNECR